MLEKKVRGGYTFASLSIGEGENVEYYVSRACGKQNYHRINTQVRGQRPCTI
jgi:hypothetical protein